MMRDNVVSLKQSAEPVRRRVTGGKVKELVTRCRGVVAETLPRLLQDLFENLDDDLYVLADKSTSDSLQTRYFESMRELRKLRGLIEEAYLHNVLNVYDNFWRGSSALKRPEPLKIDEDSLSLVENAELEEDLAVHSIVSKAESRYRRELYGLGQRLAFMAGVDELQDCENPVGPNALANGFRRAIQRWDGDLAIELVIFKLFERHVMQYVGGLYDELNDLLINADVLPKIVQRARRNLVAPSVQRARNPSKAETTEAASALIPPDRGDDRSHELMAMVTQMLSTRRIAQSDLPAFHLPVVPAPEILGALTDLQRSNPAVAPVSMADAYAAQGGLRVHLMQQLGMGSSGETTRRFAEAEQDVIDVISMLFEFIVDDRNLPDGMRALLSRLQIPMLKVAIIDRGFFGSKNHPARRLLNDLAKAAVGWVDDGDRSPNTLYGCIEGIVERVLNEFVDDVRLFEALNEEFAQFLQRDRHAAEIAEERINQVNRGQEQLKLARTRVNEVLESRLLQAGPVPAVVRDMLYDAWKDVLLLALLREGDESESWRHGLEITDQLIWSVQQKAEQTERQHLLKVIPDLLRSLREGLANISFDQHKSAQMFKELQVRHIAALRGGDNLPPIAAEPVPLEVDVGAGQEVSIQHEVESSFIPPDEHDAAARELKVGDWLEWQEQDKPVRGKLSWKSEVTGTYVFVSRKGTKVAEMTAADVAALFRGGQVKVLERVDAPLMDRALEAMLDVLDKSDQVADADASA